MSILPVTIPPKKLAQTITSTATSFKMNNILAWDGGDLVPADFGTEGYGVFINSTRTQIEIFKFDPATIADASITILERGLGYSGGDVADTSRQFPWASNDTTVQLGTDAPQLFRDFLSESNPATITALHEYDVLPQSTQTPTNDEDFATKTYVDGLTSPAISVPINQTTHGLVVGDAIKVLGVNTFEKAQADSAVNAEVVGIVTAVADVDNFTYVAEGIVTTGVPVFAAGTVLFLDPDTAGALTDTETSTVGEVNLPLAVINESGVRMTFHKYRPAVINTIAGNPIASETVAGIVEEATAAEVAAGTDVGGTGAKLFVPPSKLPSGAAPVEVFDAYENIAKGDVVGLSHYFPEIGNILISQDLETEEDMTPVIWWAERFTVPLDTSPTHVYCMAGDTGSSSQPYVTIRIRSTLTGADIATATVQVFTTTGIWIAVNVTGLLTAGQQYYMVCSSSTATAGRGTIWRTTDQTPIPNGETWKSIDTGANWIQQNVTGDGDDLNIRVAGSSNVALGHMEVFKASAAAINNRFGFFGYATEAATAGNPVSVTRARKTDLHTGLTVGRKYYLQDTNGAIGLTPGTLGIELGYAISATELYRDRSNSDHFAFASDLVIQFEGICGQNEPGSSSSAVTISDRVNVGAGDTVFASSVSYQSEGGAQGVRFVPGNNISSNRTINACMIYPQG